MLNPEALVRYYGLPTERVVNNPGSKTAPTWKALVDYFTNRENHQPIAAVDSAIYSPYEYIKATSTSVAGIGGNSSPIVIVS